MRFANQFWQTGSAFLLILIVVLTVNAQPEQDKKNKQPDARPITIPISIRAANLKTDNTRGEIVEAGNLTVKENGENRQILSLRSTASSPLAFAILIQEDVASEVNLELRGIADFIRKLPAGSRVMIAYLRNGNLDVRQKFTEDLDKAAKSLRVISSSSTNAPFNPYVGVIDTLDRFDNLPIGRRAVLLVSDGLDASRGLESSSPTQSLDLDRAILKAQRSGTAIYSIYAATQSTGNSNSILVSYGQGSLNRLTEETGGRAFFQGSGTPVSFSPYLRELGTILSRQFALTFLSTKSKKYLRRLEVISDNPDVKIEYPKNYIPK